MLNWHHHLIRIQVPRQILNQTEFIVRIHRQFWTPNRLDDTLGLAPFLYRKKISLHSNTLNSISYSKNYNYYSKWTRKKMYFFSCSLWMGNLVLLNNCTWRDVINSCQTREKTSRNYLYSFSWFETLVTQNAFWFDCQRIHW